MIQIHEWLSGKVQTQRGIDRMDSSGDMRVRMALLQMRKGMSGADIVLLAMSRLQITWGDNEDNFVLSNVMTKGNCRCPKRVLSTWPILIGAGIRGLPQNNKGRACLVTWPHTVCGKGIGNTLHLPTCNCHSAYTSLMTPMVCLLTERDSFRGDPTTCESGRKKGCH